LPPEQHRSDPENEDYHQYDEDEQADVSGRIEPIADLAWEGATYGEGDEEG